MKITRLVPFFAGLALVGLAASQVRKFNWQAPLLASATDTSSHTRNTATTNNVIEDRIAAEGRVATYTGAQVTLSAEIAGKIERLLVEEKSLVKKGDLIADIKADEQRAALAEAKARIAEIDAEITLAELELKRSKNLFDQSTATRQEFDRAQRNFDVATAQRQTALATVKRLEATVAKSEVRSPIDGVVLNRYAHPGEMADIGTRLVTIADTNRVRIEAEVDEFDAGRVRVGQPVKITAEGYSGPGWAGTVEEIPDAVSEKNLKPQDPGRPTDARVLRVKIRFKEPTPLKLGQRVELELVVAPHQSR